MTFAYLDRQIELASRGIAVEERKVAVEETKAKGPPVPESIPPDLMRRITAWQDVDARDMERKNLMDLYAEYGDWTKVRAALPKAPSEDIPEHPELGLVA